MTSLRWITSNVSRATLRAGVAFAFAVSMCGALAGCSKEPTAPGVHTLSGHVVLTGFLVGPDGQFAGTRVVGDADGVAVDLLYGTRVVAQTTTADGVYRFSGVSPGGYTTRARILDGIGDESNELTIAQADVNARDTLRIVSKGDLYPIPNPFETSMTVYFELPDTEQVSVKILDIAGQPVRTIFHGLFPKGLQSAYWDGHSQSGQDAVDPMYWVTFEGPGDREGGDYRAQLLFRRPPPGSAEEWPAYPPARAGGRRATP